MSTNGGATWVNQLRIQGASDGYTNPVTRSVEITSGLGGELGDVALRFHYYQANYEWWWAIDNVKVRCARLACTPCAQTPGPPGEAGITAPLTVRREAGNLVFEWGAPAAACQPADHALYAGDLGALGTAGYGHDRVLTCAAGATSLTVPEMHPAIGAADYYLVVSDNAVQEGSYGRDSDGAERPASTSACHEAQNLVSCGP